MGFMEWTPKYELGIPEMDAQHRQWLDVLNRFYDRLAEKDLSGGRGLWDEAHGFTLYHFREEEYFLAAINYPYYQEQRTAHSLIIDRLQGVRKDLDSGHIPGKAELARIFKLWFKEHILIEDKKYASYFSRYQAHQPVLG